jgi:hypothetical protein
MINTASGEPEVVFENVVCACLRGAVVVVVVVRGGNGAS